MKQELKHIYRFFLISIFLLFIVTPKFINAHPHVFIDTKIKVYFDDKGMSGVKVSWTFDDLFSELMMDEFDEDFDEQFSKEEQKVIYSKAFTNLKKFNYFTEIEIDGKAFDIKYVTNFSAILDDGIMVYSFFIPCHVLANNTNRKIDIYTYDNSYYMDLSLASNDISFVKSQNYKITYQVAEATDKKYYFDQISPQVLHLTFRK